MSPSSTQPGVSKRSHPKVFVKGVAPPQRIEVLRVRAENETPLTFKGDDMTIEALNGDKRREEISREIDGLKGELNRIEVSEEERAAEQDVVVAMEWLQDAQQRLAEIRRQRNQAVLEIELQIETRIRDLRRTVPAAVIDVAAAVERKISEICSQTPRGPEAYERMNTHVAQLRAARDTLRVMAVRYFEPAKLEQIESLL